MRPTLGQVLSGMALGAVATAMLVAPERILVAQEEAVPGLVLEVADQRRVVRAAPIPQRPRVVRKAAPVSTVAPVRAIARSVPVSQPVTPPPPPVRRATPPPPPPPPRPAAPPPPPRVVTPASYDDDDGEDDDSDDDDSDDDGDDGDDDD